MYNTIEGSSKILYNNLKNQVVDWLKEQDESGFYEPRTVFFDVNLFTARDKRMKIYLGPETMGTQIKRTFYKYAILERFEDNKYTLLHIECTREEPEKYML